VEDHARGIWEVLRCGSLGEIYNMGGQAEVTNIYLVRALLRLLKKPESLIRHVADRAGHDRRYAMNSSKLRKELGWLPGYNLDHGLSQTVEWYLANPVWWQRVLSEAYRASNTLYLKGD
jgi:dTDP-glucose 4,6-dehydratase